MPTETVDAPAPPAVEPAPIDLDDVAYAQRVARDAYLVSVKNGTPLTGEQLGAKFGRSGRWGRDRIAEARPSVAAETLAEPVATEPVATATPAMEPAATEPPPATATKPAATRRGNGNGKTRGKSAPRRRAATPAAAPVPVAAPVATAPPARRWWQRIDGARLVAWSGFAFGSVMSIAANVLYTWLPADTHPAGWQPPIAQQVGAAVWPIALLIAVEVLSRVQWPDQWWWAFTRFGGAGLVAVASGGISYVHLHEVLVKWDYGYLPSIAGPVVLDGLMIVSGFALLAMTHDPKEGTTGA